MEAAEDRTEARYLDYQRAAAYVGLSRFTLHRLVKAGELRAIRVGSAVRFDVNDLNEFMTARRF